MPDDEPRESDITQPSDEIFNAFNATVKYEPQPVTLPPAPVSEYDVLTKPPQIRRMEKLNTDSRLGENPGDIGELRGTFYAPANYPNTICETTQPRLFFFDFLSFFLPTLSVVLCARSV